MGLPNWNGDDGGIYLGCSYPAYGLSASFWRVSAPFRCDRETELEALANRPWRIGSESDFSFVEQLVNRLRYYPFVFCRHLIL